MSFIDATVAKVRPNNHRFLSSPGPVPASPAAVATSTAHRHGSPRSPIGRRIDTADPSVTVPGPQCPVPHPWCIVESWPRPGGHRRPGRTVRSPPTRIGCNWVRTGTESGCAAPIAADTTGSAPEPAEPPGSPGHGDAGAVPRTRTWTTVEEPLPPTGTPSSHVHPSTRSEHPNSPRSSPRNPHHRHYHRTDAGSCDHRHRRSCRRHPLRRCPRRACWTEPVARSTASAAGHPAPGTDREWRHLRRNTSTPRRWRRPTPPRPPSRQPIGQPAGADCRHAGRTGWGSRANRCPGNAMEGMSSQHCDRTSGRSRDRPATVSAGSGPAGAPANRFRRT